MNSVYVHNLQFYLCHSQAPSIVERITFFSKFNFMLRIKVLSEWKLNSPQVLTKDHCIISFYSHIKKYMSRKC